MLNKRKEIKMKIGKALKLSGIFLTGSTALYTGSIIAEEPASGPIPEENLNLLTVEQESTLVAPLVSSGYKALLYHSDGSGSASSFKNALIATGQFGPADIDIIQMSSTPTSLSDLQEYDCVYTWTNYVAPAIIAHGDRLAEYVDVGGGVILLTYGLSPTNKPWHMQGRIMSAGYSPFANTTVSLSSFPRNLDFGSAMIDHPLLENVFDFVYGGNSNYGEVTLDSGAVLVASDNYGVPLLATNANSSVAAINLFPTGFSKSPGVFPALANACSVVSVINVDVDIKPGSDENSINLSSNGSVPVAIFGSDSFDVNDIDTSSLSFADAGVKVVGKKNHELCSIDDVNGDGIPDLVCHFVTIDLAALDGTSSEATIKGTLMNGKEFRGVDTVNIVKE